MLNDNKVDHDLSAREKEVLKIYKSLNSSNRHKMLAIPVCKIPKDYIIKCISLLL